MKTIAKPTETKITKRYGFDNMRLDAKLPSGASISYRVGRSRETLELAFSNDDATLTLQTKEMQAWLKIRKGETNQHVFDRLENVLKSCRSGAEVMAKIKTI